MSEFVIRPAGDPLPGTIASAARAHRNLPLMTEFADADTWRCHVDDLPHQFPGGLRHLVSSHAGALRTILLAIPNYVVREHALAAVFSRLPSALPDDTHFVILTHAAAKDTVTAWFAGRSHVITPVADEVAFTMWAEDPYAAGADHAGRSALIEPQLFDRNADDIISSLVAAGAGFERIRSPLIFQGGNVLIGDTFYLVGADYLLLSWQTVEDHGAIADQDGKFTAEIKHAIQRDFLDPTRQAHFLGCDRTLRSENVIPNKLPMGENGAMVDVSEHIHNGSNAGTVQPLFHIDMFVTLVGRENDRGPFRILVGDPRHAAQLAGIELPDHAQADAFDEIARKVALHDDFALERNPLPYVHLDFRRKEDGTFHRWWYFASANNAIVERRNAQHRRVWLPSFGFAPWRELAATDAANWDIWKKFGFDVTMMPNCHALAQNLGVIHCIKKYLTR